MGVYSFKPKGGVETNVTPSGDGEVLNLTFDYSRRFEIRCLGQKLSSVSYVEVFLQGSNVQTADWTVGTPVVDSTGTKINFQLTNVSAVAGNVYEIYAKVAFSGGNKIIVGLDMEVKVPQGGMVVPCGCN